MFFLTKYSDKQYTELRINNQKKNKAFISLRKNGTDTQQQPWTTVDNE